MPEDHLARAELMGAPREAIERLRWRSIRPVAWSSTRCSRARRRIATASGRLEDLVPLGAVLADLERFAEADAVYRQALYSYDDVSPFPLAWVCFQLGMLWGELVPVPDPDRCRALVSTRHRLLAGLCEGAGAPGGDLLERGRTGDAESCWCPRFRAAIRRSGGVWPTC